MSFAARWHRFALAAGLGAGMIVLGAPAGAEQTGSRARAAAAGEFCELGRVREGKHCMHLIAGPGDCAVADCGDGAIGLVRDRFSPTDVAGVGDGFTPPPPGPGDGPDRQPTDFKNGPPTPPPPITVIESPAPIDPLPGLGRVN
jgi:hypothetical protein